MRRGLPIYSKVLAWLLVNVLLLVVLVIGFLRMHFHLSMDWMLIGPAGDRISMIGDRVTGELSNLPENEWPVALQGYEKTYGVTFALFDRSGVQVIGKLLNVPSDLLPKLADKRPVGERPPQRRPPPRRPADVKANASPDASADGAMNRPSDAPPKPRFMQRAGDPAQYWAGIHLDLVFGPDSKPLTLVMVSDTITGRGLFVDLWPWAGLGAACLIISALLWMPFVSGLTRAIGRLNNAARIIAKGNFNERVSEKRNDELGELSTSVNTMAAQLGDYVEQQRRITADVAHELCSPIARMQMALGVVEQRSTPEQAGHLKKLDNELQHMARLVEEVLAFSKAETLPESEAATDIDLRELIGQVIAREAPETSIHLQIDDLNLHTLRSALDRAIGNVLRNAVRYASEIEIHAGKLDDHVIIQILDQGPGVPTDALTRLFEPFYRPEAARGRNTGGSGLGLAITRRCIEACGGTVTARNRDSGGLEIEMRLVC